MGLEATLFSALWEHIQGYKSGTLRYVRGWYKVNALNIPLARLPAVALYPTGVAVDSREAEGDRFRLSLVLRGSVQHFDPEQSAEGAAGRVGILDLYHDLDRVLFSAFPHLEVTVDNLTLLTQVFPLFSDAPEVRDIQIGNAAFSTATYNDEYPNLDVTIPVALWYIKSDEARRVSL